MDRKLLDLRCDREQREEDYRIALKHARQTPSAHATEWAADRYDAMVAARDAVRCYLRGLQPTELAGIARDGMARYIEATRS